MERVKADVLKGVLTRRPEVIFNVYNTHEALRPAISRYLETILVKMEDKDRLHNLLGYQVVL